MNRIRPQEAKTVDNLGSAVLMLGGLMVSDDGVCVSFDSGLMFHHEEGMRPISPAILMIEKTRTSMVRKIPMCNPKKEMRPTVRIRLV